VLDPDLVDFCRLVHPRLVGSLSLYCYRADVAEELAQETLLRVCEHWPKLRDGFPQAWAYQTGFNLAKSWLRRRLVERSVQARLEAGTPPAIVESDDDTRLVVRRAVSALPPRQRIALICRYYLDLSVSGAADIMKCAPGTVKALTSGAIANLRKELGSLDLEVDHAQA
jgi:RNA polymerase sigma factor (sigma-70 family)